MNRREEALEIFKASLLHRWTPLVALVSNDEAESYCQTSRGTHLLDIFESVSKVASLNNGLGGASSAKSCWTCIPVFLIQYGHGIDVLCMYSVPIRTPSEYPIRLHELRLRFCNGLQVTPLNSPSDLEKADRLLAEVCHTEFDSKIVYESLGPSFFDECRDVLCRLLRFQVHETQDNPLVCTF